MVMVMLQIIRFSVLAVLLVAIPWTSVSASTFDEGPVWVTLKGEAQTKGLRVTLGDIANVEALDPRIERQLRRLVVGRFLRGRRQMVFQRETIRRLIEDQRGKAGALHFEGAQSVRVRPELVRIRPSRLRAQVDRHLKEALAGQKGVGEIRPLDVLKGIDVPAARFSIDFRVRPDQKNSRYAGRVNLAVEIRVDGELAEVVAVPMLVNRRGKVVVAKRRIGRGRVVRLEDLDVKEIDLGRMATEYYESPAELLGMIAKVNLQATQPLRRSSFSSQPVIRRGDLVTARVKIGGILVKALCKASKDGAPGDRITVINIETKKVVYAVVADSHTVDVVTGL